MRPLSSPALVGALTLATLSFLAASGCSDRNGVGVNGNVVGGACVDDRDCADICLLGPDYPDGTCAVRCDHDDQCPSGSYCVDSSGGVCLLACEQTADCRFPYSCDWRSRRGHPGDALVCRD